MSADYQVQPIDKLFRWLHPSQFKWDEMRPTSAAFRDTYMSIDIAELTNLDESYKRAQKARKDAVVSFKAGLAFELKQKVNHCPTQICELANESVCVADTGCGVYQADVSSKKLVCTNHAHGCVIGNKTGSISKSFTKNCDIEIFPPAPN